MRVRHDISCCVIYVVILGLTLRITEWAFRQSTLIETLKEVRYDAYSNIVEPWESLGGESDTRVIPVDISCCDYLRSKIFVCEMILIPWQATVDDLNHGHERSFDPAISTLFMERRQAAR